MCELRRKHVPSVFVYRGTVCAYDAGSSGLNPIIVNNERVCSETTQSGTFIFDVPTADPDGSGNTDLVLKAFAKNSHFDFFLNNTGDKVVIDDNEPPREIFTEFQDVGFFDISEVLYLSVPIEHQHFWALDRLSDIQEWYDDNVVANTEKISVIYDPTLCSPGPGYNPDTSTMFLSHTEKFNGDICSLNVNSHLTNTDTLAHEYGHAVFYQTYDSFSSAYPVVDITDPSGYHSPVHSNSDGTAWVEGWAFFMATAYSGSPIYQPSYMIGQWNFETRTHNEVSDLNFAGKSFVTGNSGEGNVVAALWDALDTVNESGDDQQNLLDEIWDTMGDFVESDETVIATDISQYKDDWNDDGNPDIENIFNHNTLVYATTPPPSDDPTFFIEDFEGDLSKWDLTNGNSALSERWELKTPFKQIPDYPATNIVAGTDNDCDLSCIMTLKTSLDLSELADAKLFITRWVDRSLDPDKTPKEGLLVEVSGNGGSTWSTAYEWTADSNHDIDSWFKGEDISDGNVYNLPSSELTNNFKIRISGTSSASSETIYIDDVRITSSSAEPPDTTAPVIILSPPTVMDVSVNTSFVEPGYSAIDDVDGDITSNVIVAGSVVATTLGTYNITYDVLDAANNPAVQKIRTVNVIDALPPVFSFVPSDQTFEATGLNTPLSESDYGTATATDNYDPSHVITNNAPSTFPLGDTTIIWTATDQSNNFVDANQIITVQDTIPPVITLTSTLSDPTNVSPIPITINFDENISGFTMSDIVVSNGMTSNFTGSGQSYYVDITPITNGEVTIDIPSNVVQDTYGNGNHAASQFSIIFGTNTAPTVNDLNETTDEDTPITITLSGSDADGDALSFATVTLPSSGTLSVITGINDTSASITYTPNSNFYGTDTFTYLANDGTTNSNIATVTLTVTSINDSPSASDDSATTNEDTPVVISVLDNDTDVDGDTLIVTDESIDDSATPISFDDSSNTWWSIPSSFTTMFAQYTTAIKNTIENTLLVLVPSISAIPHDDIPSVTVEKMESMQYYSSNYTQFEENKNEINQARAEIKQLKSDLQDVKDDMNEHKMQFINSQKDLKNAQKQFETRGITNDELIQAQMIHNDANDTLNDTQDRLDKITTEFKTAKVSLKISKQIKKLIAGDTDLEKIDDRFEKIFKNTRSDGTLISDPKIPVYLRVTNQSILPNKIL